MKMMKLQQRNGYFYVLVHRLFLHATSEIKHLNSSFSCCLIIYFYLEDKMNIMVITLENNFAWRKIVDSLPSQTARTRSNKIVIAHLFCFVLAIEFHELFKDF